MSLFVIFLGLSALGVQAAGSLTGTGTAITASQNINLTTQGTADWVHWGTTTATSFDHKVASGTTPVGLISNYTVVGSGTVVRYATSFVNCAWTDGTPTASATNSSEVYLKNNGSGFSVTAPADTTTRTLTIYVGGYNDDATLTAHLSDGSAADFVDSSYGYNKPGNSDGAHYQAVYTLTYGAASSGQTLTVSWVQTSSLNTSGNATLQAATLAVAPLAPTYLTATGTSSQIGLTWAASSGATSYNLYRGTASGGESATAYQTGLTGTSYIDTSVTAGATYYYTLKAVNTGGTSIASNEAVATASSTPSGVVATGGDAQSLLAWRPVGGATGYNIYRATSSGGEGTTPINSQPVVANAYLDTGLSAGTTYYYTVASVFASAPQSAQSIEVNGSTSLANALQDSNWSVTQPSGSNTPDPVITSNSTSISTSIGTTLLASATVSGTTTSQVSTSAEASYATSNWTFTWKGTTWPTLYVIQHQQKALYSASVNSGTGNAQIENTGGGTLVSASYPVTGTQIISTPTLVLTFNTLDLTQPSLIAATKFHIAGGMPAAGQTTGTLTGWSETSSSTTLTQSAYTQQWFQSHFASPSNIVLNFTVPNSDITATSSLSNSTSQGSTSALASVVDLYFGS